MFDKEKVLMFITPKLHFIFFKEIAVLIFLFFKVYKHIFHCNFCYGGFNLSYLYNYYRFII